jgi:hypothetical protein
MENFADDVLGQIEQVAVFGQAFGGSAHDGISSGKVWNLNGHSSLRRDRPLVDFEGYGLLGIALTLAAMAMPASITRASRRAGRLHLPTEMIVVEKTIRWATLRYCPTYNCCS